MEMFLMAFVWLSVSGTFMFSLGTAKQLLFPSRPPTTHTLYLCSAKWTTTTVGEKQKITGFPKAYRYWGTWNLSSVSGFPPHFFTLNIQVTESLLSDMYWLSCGRATAWPAALCISLPLLVEIRALPIEVDKSYLSGIKSVIVIIMFLVRFLAEVQLVLNTPLLCGHWLDPCPWTFMKT